MPNPRKNFNITLRSIDLGATEIVEDYSLHPVLHRRFTFSIQRRIRFYAAFHPIFRHNLLHRCASIAGTPLRHRNHPVVGCSCRFGMGTNGVLTFPATVLGVLSDFLGLNRTEHEICNYTLALEQLLTTGGGWQDQYGGIFAGRKNWRTTDEFDQTPVTSWLPDYLFNAPSYRDCHLLYYTGITRTAKNILQEIVTGMFLNKSETLLQLADMKQHALDLADAIQRNNFEEFGQYVAKAWEQNKRLDCGTNPASIEKSSHW